MNSTMAKDLQKLFIDRGYNPVIGTIYQQQEYWLSWYRGDVDGFHNTQKLNYAGTYIPVIKPSLQMAKKVSEDVTSLLFNENVELMISGDDAAQEALDRVLDENNFYDEMTNFVELSCVFGTGVIVEYLADGETKLNFLFGNRVVVIDYDNTTIKALAVIQQFSKNKRKYNHIMYHTFKDGKYRIKHEMYSSKNAQGLGQPSSLDALFSEAELKKMRHSRVENGITIIEYYVEYETDTPHFQAFKLGISNNYDVRSPMGISLYANSIGTLENIDEKYYSSRMDSINSRKRVFVDDDATKVAKVKTESGVQHKKYFDPSETQYQVLKGMAREGQKSIEIYAPAYDSMQHEETIQMELNYLSSKCMLGTNYYSYKDGAVGYQNELGLVLSSSDTYRNRQKNINRLKVVLINLMKSIMYLEKENSRYSGDLDKLEYDVQFDDDIMTDDATITAQYRLDSQDGLIPEYMYIMRAYSVNKEEAIEILADAENQDVVVEPFNDDAPPTEDEPDGEE